MGETPAQYRGITRAELRQEYREHIEDVATAVMDGLLENKLFLERAKGPPGETGPPGASIVVDVRKVWRTSLLASLGLWATETIARLARRQNDRLGKLKKDAGSEAVERVWQEHHEVVEAEFYRPLSATCRTIWRDVHETTWPQARDAVLRARMRDLASEHIATARRQVDGGVLYSSSTLIDELAPICELIESLIWEEVAK